MLQRGLLIARLAQVLGISEADIKRMIPQAQRQVGKQKSKAVAPAQAAPTPHAHDASEPPLTDDDIYYSDEDLAGDTSAPVYVEPQAPLPQAQQQAELALLGGIAHLPHLLLEPCIQGQSIEELFPIGSLRGRARQVWDWVLNESITPWQNWGGLLARMRTTWPESQWGAIQNTLLSADQALQPWLASEEEALDTQHKRAVMESAKYLYSMRKQEQTTRQAVPDSPQNPSASTDIEALKRLQQDMQAREGDPRRFGKR